MESSGVAKGIRHYCNALLARGYHRKESMVNSTHATSEMIDR